MARKKQVSRRRPVVLIARAAAVKPFRVVTYNVHKCKGMDWRVSPARIADVAMGLDAQIIATQEILLSQAAEISERLGIPYTIGDARHHAGEPYGNAVISKL